MVGTSGASAGSSTTSLPLGPSSGTVPATTDFARLGLHSACARGNYGAAKFALANGQSPSAVQGGVQPIHCAASSGSERIMRLLLEHGADVNAPRLSRRYDRGGKVEAVGTTGATPMHFAAANGHRNIVFLLLQAGARADIREKHGWTAEDVAQSHGHVAIADLLRDAATAQRDAPPELLQPTTSPTAGSIAAHPVQAIKRGLSRAASNPSLAMSALSPVAPSHSWMRSSRGSASSGSDVPASSRPMLGSSMSSSSSLNSFRSSVNRRRPSLSSVFERAGEMMGLGHATEGANEGEETVRRRSVSRPAPLTLIGSSSAGFHQRSRSDADSVSTSEDDATSPRFQQRAMSAGHARRANSSSDGTGPISPRMSPSLTSPPLTAPAAAAIYQQHRPRNSSTLSRSSSMRIGPDGSQVPYDDVIEDDDDDEAAADEPAPGQSLDDPTPRRPPLGVVPRSQSSGLSGRSTSSSFSSQTQGGPSRASSAVAYTGDSAEGEGEASDRFPGPDEIRRARGDSIGSTSNASDLSRLHRSPHSPLAGSSTRSSRSGSDPPRNLFVPASLGSTSSILSGTTAPTSLGDDQPMTPSMAHSMVVKAEQDLLRFRPSEHGSTLSEQLAAYGASLEIEREVTRQHRMREKQRRGGGTRSAVEPYFYERLDKDGTRTRVNRGGDEGAGGSGARPPRAWKQGTLDRRRPSVPDLRQDLSDAAPQLHVPSATEPVFALQRSVDKVYDNRAAQSARLMVPIASSSTGSTSDRRSPSPSRSSTIDATSVRRPSASGSSHHRRSSSAPEDGATIADLPDAPTLDLSALHLGEPPESSSTRKGRFRKAFGALTGR